MSRPPKAEITDEMILSRMEFGETTTVKRMARRLSTAEERVRVKMNQLVDEGKILRKRESAAMNSFFLYFLDEKSEPIAGGAFEIPTPFVGVNLSGELTGFGAEIERRAALCMLVRRYA